MSSPRRLCLLAMIVAFTSAQHDRAIAQTPKPPAASAKPPKITGHWGEDAIGFRWTEQDSVDNRWNQTDVGPFLASIIPLPKLHPVAKGLSIRVGNNNEATVCYDTATLTLRAAWTGGFLHFDPARYGLIAAPRPAGELLFASAPAAKPPAENWKYRGFTLQNGRIVLQSTIGTTEILESPWVESREGTLAITRSFTIAPSQQPITLPVFFGAGKQQLDESPGVPIVTMAVADRTLAFATIGKQGAVTAIDDGSVILRVPAANETRHIKLLQWSGLHDQLAAFRALVRESAAPVSLEPLTRPGVPQWTASITTRGKLGTGDGPYVLDTLALPFDNPYRALLFVSGLDFFSNGDIALCTVHGDVWRVSGVDDALSRLTWKRYATGLFQLLGIKVVDDKVYALGRDQITRLHDRNSDGEADFYECFYQAHITSPGGHDYVTCLETDDAGNFYFLHATQGVVRVSRDGSRMDVVATGFRNPNGLGIGPGDVITVAPQEGEWTPASGIFEVRTNGHGGYGGPKRSADRPLGYDPPLCWIPRLTDNSSGGQVWVTSDRWGPLQGQLLHFSYGKCRMMLVPRETVDGQTQGGTVEFPLDFDSGVCRGRFSPHDGQLYVGGLRGWASASVQDGCLQRVRYTGSPFDMPVSVRTLKNGLALTFTRPLDRDSAESPDHYAIHQWNYRYGQQYGSPEFRVTDPQVEGRDEVDVRSATLLDDRTVFLEIAKVQPVSQMTVACTIAAVDGTPIRRTLAYTIHRVRNETIDPSRLTRRTSPGDLPADDVNHLQPGVALRFEQAGQRDTRHARMFAWRVPAGTAPTSFLEPGPFRITAEGFLRLSLKGEYRFRLEGAGDAELSINGQSILAASGDLADHAAVPVALHKGYNRVAIRYRSPTNDDALLRLMWDSPEIPDEPVPPTVVWSDRRDAALVAATSLRRGRELFTVHHCANCHASPQHFGGNVDRTESHRATPDLRTSGNRLRPDWLYHWILDPAGVRNDALMPCVFDKSQAASRQDAADIAVWLATRGSTTNATSEARGKDAINQGATLFADLGCIACHRLTEPTAKDEYNRVSLHFTAAKLQPGALEAFLREPHLHHSHSRMPNFHLNQEEAAALGAYLQSVSKGRFTEASELRSANPDRGRELFRSRGCANCHTVDDPPQPPSALQAAVFNGARSNGCLAVEPTSAGRAPRFNVSPSDRAALTAFLATDGRSLARRDAAEDSRQLFQHLRCAACHSRDHVPSPRGSIIVDETETGLIPETLPNLTWAGEKLRAEWTARLLKGESPQTRHWLKARMPAFPAYAERLSTGLAAEHGLKIDTQPTTRFDRDLAAIGHKLSEKNSGLDCRQCHGVGAKLPLGDGNTQIAPGINFDLIAGRLRPAFYHRFVFDPPRYDLGTKMPKLVVEERATKIPQYFDGDAQKQFDALWHYIESVARPQVPANVRQ